MRSKYIVLAMVPLLLLASCGIRSTPEDKLVKVIAHSICVLDSMSYGTQSMMSGAILSDTVEHPEDILTKLEDVQRDFFDNKEEMEQAEQQIKDIHKFELKIRSLSKAKCNAGEESIGLFTSFLESNQ